MDSWGFGNADAGSRVKFDFQGCFMFFDMAILLSFGNPELKITYFPHFTHKKGFLSTIFINFLKILQHIFSMTNIFVKVFMKKETLGFFDKYVTNGTQYSVIWVKYKKYVIFNSKLSKIDF